MHPVRLAQMLPLALHDVCARRRIVFVFKPQGGQRQHVLRITFCRKETTIASQVGCQRYGCGLILLCSLSLSPSLSLSLSVHDHCGHCLKMFVLLARSTGVLLVFVALRCAHFNRSCSPVLIVPSLLYHDFVLGGGVFRCVHRVPPCQKGSFSFRRYHHPVDALTSLCSPIRIRAYPFWQDQARLCHPVAPSGTRGTRHGG